MDNVELTVEDVKAGLSGRDTSNAISATPDDWKSREN